MQHASSRTTLAAVREHFLSGGGEGGGAPAQQPVAIARGAGGVPKLLSRQAFAALCDRLEAQLQGADSGEQEAEAPTLLQVGPGRRTPPAARPPVREDARRSPAQGFVPPFLDLRFVTSLCNDGADLSCHTFQRRFSARYLPLRTPERPALDAGGGAGGSHGTEEEEQQAEEGRLGAEELAAVDRGLDRVLGPVDPTLRMQMRKAAHVLVKYVQVRPRGCCMTSGPLWPAPLTRCPPSLACSGPTC